MTEHAPEKKILLTPVLKLFMATMVLANIAGGMYRPILALYLQELGASIANIGLFFTLGAVIPLAFQIFGGWLSDSIGRLQAIAIGSIGGVLAYAAYLFAPSWEWLLAASAGTAIATSFVGPSFQAFIAEQSTEENRGRVYGITSAIFGVVGVVGPPLGGYLAQNFSFKVMFIVAAAMYTTAAIIRVLMARHASKSSPEKMEKPSFASFKGNLSSMLSLLLLGGVVTWIFISDGIRDVAFGLVGNLFSVYMENIRGITLIQIGWLQSLSAIAAIALMAPSGWLSDKKGERVGISLGFLIISGALAGFLMAKSFIVFALAWVVFGAGQALIEPAYSSLISKAIPDKLRGTAFGFFSSSIGLISLPAPMIGAYLWEQFNPSVPFFIPLIAMLATIPIMWVKFKLPDNSSNPQATETAATG